MIKLPQIMFQLVIVFLGILISVFASVTLDKHATCTVSSAGDSGVDDVFPSRHLLVLLPIFHPQVPAAVSAIKLCGNGGIIVFSAGKTYAIRSTLDITGCINCEIQIEGTLKLSDDTDFWNGKRAIIYINGISGATLTTTTGAGIVDGNGVPYWQGMLAIVALSNQPIFHSVCCKQHLFPPNSRLYQQL